ncbi:MAG: tRNA (adenosine(37)-N6)-threonylcarbamoyltransferase complex ATPase subunit type 1 TsaE [Campylobacter sp.]|nr:tRNA (adenosine(37)-N6)-threonylcarbamoyltransferase complex ATPase subunit type 1 TsaE [Campylobacter sp.]
MSKKFEFVLSLNEISQIAEILPKKGIILLMGDLASGKTTLVKAIAKTHGIDPKIVNSPTFSIMQKYGQIYHYDIYNDGSSGLLKNGLFENFFEDGLHIVEWADENLIELLKKYLLDFCIVKIEINGDKRKYEVNNAYTRS